MSSEAIKDLIIAVIDEQKATEALVGVQQDSGGDSATAISRLKRPGEVVMEQDAGDVSGDTPKANVKQELVGMSDNEIERAFEAFEKAAVSGSSRIGNGI